MNKKQELRRNFRFLSIFGYSLILGNGWVLALIGAIAPLTNGGTAGGIWGYLIVICGLFFTTLSMAEMASMAPTAGGQYRKQIARLCFTGWLTDSCFRLGVRIRSKILSEASVIPDRLAVCSGMANSVVLDSI